MNNSLMEHKFVSKLVVDIFNFYSNQEVDSELYAYCKNVQHNLSRTKDIIDTLRLIRMLVAERHPDIATENNSVFDKEFILGYHLENYFARLNSYKPTIIQLIAAVYEWHIADANEPGNALLKTASEEGLDNIAPVLHSIDTALAQANPLKSNAGKAGMTAADISLIESVKDAENLLKESLGAKDAYDEDKNEYYNNSVSSNLAEMAELEEHLLVNLISVLDELYDAYCQKVPGGFME